jgi:hypothetical protein
MSHVEDTLTQILLIGERRELQYERRWSHYALFREYIRRIAIWGQEFGWSPSYGNLSYTDLAGVIQPALMLPENAMAIVNKQPFGLREVRYFFNALKWAALEDSDETGRFRQLNPYELIFLIYQRGGFVSGEHGWIEITGSSFWADSRKTSDILNYAPLDLSKENLDMLDERGNVKSG